MKYWITGLHKSIGLGFLWLCILFIIDAVDSIFLLQKTTKHIKAEPYIEQLLVHEVQNYVLQILFGYLLVGVLAGVLMHIFLRIFYVKPTTIKSSINAWLTFGLLVSIWGYMRNIITQPCLHTWLDTAQPAVSDALDLWHVDLIAILAIICFFARSWYIWPKKISSSSL